TDPAVSRLHCELVRVPGGLHFRDLGSKNGSWVGGCRLECGVLGPGARVQLGGTVIEVRLERQRLKQALWQGGDRFGPLLGASPPMHRLFAKLARVAPGDSSVLITGESGTGKEEVARAIHESSARKDGPFVVVDGASLSRSLADLELFGHERGAFTGAEVARAGAFERASGGTVFLDEIGELPIEVQPKLLRVLEDRTVQRLGSGARQSVDVRVLAATHRSLATMVNEGSFREDLLYRLAVLELAVPPLRDRGGDVRLLARHFLRRFAPDRRDLMEALDRDLEKHAGYRWPGNVRELRSFVRRLVALGEASVGAPAIETEMPDTIRVDLPYADAKEAWLGAFERQYLGRLLDETGGNVTEASRRSGLARSRLHELVKKHGLR
ncbi:MAG TPA: sigma 54-interacting transcriptional regulator, partial [Polyangiaceae bacterium LLY-WYZ-15_(1-7)]|nr:sigma 54-interacting transcriptional regulator [Polyangiaceae bacterium LLY-WYZ-15_(1-7)]